MHKIIWLAMTFFSWVTLAEQTVKLQYFENYPNNKQTLVFKATQSCKSNPDFLQIREFNSKKK